MTRACLEELAKREGLSISVITKSNQIVRDIDVFKKIAERSSLSLNITITTLRPRLARLLEPRAPRPDLRVAAVKQLIDAGLAVGVSASPLIPGITDREGDLEAVAAAVTAAGAQWFFSGALFLMPSSAKQFLPFVRRNFRGWRNSTRVVRKKWICAGGIPAQELPSGWRGYARSMVFQRGRGRNATRSTPCAQMSLEIECGELQKPETRQIRLGGNLFAEQSQLEKLMFVSNSADLVCTCLCVWLLVDRRPRSLRRITAVYLSHDDFVLEAAGGHDQQERAHGEKRQAVHP